MSNFQAIFEAHLYLLIFCICFVTMMSRGPLNLKAVFSKDRTFRPKKKFDPGTTKFELHKKAQASLRSGNLSSICK